jgi:hypothetical protein
VASARGNGQLHKWLLVVTAGPKRLYNIGNQGRGEVALKMKKIDTYPAIK